MSLSSNNRANNMTEAKDWANRVYAKYLDDTDLQDHCQTSVEFYRCMMYESNVIPNIWEIDGTELYSTIVDAIEQMVVDDNMVVDMNM